MAKLNASSRQVAARPFCPVAVLAKRYAEIDAVERKLLASAQGIAEDQRRYLNDAAEKDCHYAFHDVELAASLATARSVEGAMFQIAVVSKLVDELVEFAGEDPKTEYESGVGYSRFYQVQQLERKLDRLLWSIRDVFESETKVDLRSFGVDRIMPDRCRIEVPPTTIEERAFHRAGLTARTA